MSGQFITLVTRTAANLCVAHGLVDSGEGAHEVLYHASRHSPRLGALALEILLRQVIDAGVGIDLHGREVGEALDLCGHLPWEFSRLLEEYGNTGIFK